MNNLLDTHVLIWFFEGNQNLSVKAKAVIENQQNTNFVSIASFWEIAIKISVGKLSMAFSMEELQVLVIESGMEILPVQTAHTFLLQGLPFHHKDPFDRLLLAQAVCEKMYLVSGDEIFDAYLADLPVQRSW